MLFGTATLERMRIDSSGVVMVGTTDSVLYNNTSGGGINLHGGGTNRVDVARDDEVCMTLNRMTGDGVVLSIYGQGSFEGGLQVSGSTVSVAGFSGMHESSGIPEDTKAGTVVSTIDVLDTYTEGVKKDQERADHAKIKVSDVSGDKRVYGVFHSLNDQNKPLITAVGIASVRVAGACAGGDLLESAGDGTAKVQSDDVIRSSTLGKVTIGNSNEEEKLVSCVMYCG
jgi:hypothetical protein